jgi:hypothetical protein
MTVPAQRADHAPPPAPTFIRPALGLLAGLGVTMLIVGAGVLVATLAALRGVDPARFVATPGYLVVVTLINLLGTVAGGVTTARITVGRSFYTVLLLAVIMLMSGVAHALKDAPKPGEPAWYPIGLAVLAAAGALAGGLLERRGLRRTTAG